ncbi:1-phosphatidylinositol-4-phosphate 5-kinase [Ceratobasidium sp. AG-Ba]|nr:1-phosphatidylinositol-4-phosphate 5-kinase [Ceratobasidium sp. AG-Ba]QRW04739.1 1-phosphatidylinositol-4-phosphate 5-kinase [Ceratobasidium sp. AG-Ba]
MSASVLTPQSESPSEPVVNPIHLLAAQSVAATASREVHIDKVERDHVVLRTGPQPESLVNRAERKVVGAVHSIAATVTPHGRSSDASKYGAMAAADSPRATSPQNVVLSDSSGTIKKSLKQLYPTGPAFDPPPSPPASDEMLPDAVQAEEPAEEDVLAALSAQPRSASPETSKRVPSNVSFGAGDDQQQDGLLHPPARAGPSVPVPTRRNTTGTLAASTSPSKAARKMQHSHSQSGGPALGHTRTRSQTMAGQDLHSDILKEAEQIRRERNLQRTRDQKDEQPSDKVLVGNLIGEDHANYVLMYNMLTGIRIGVSRCQAKVKRPLTEEDFTAAHKFSFDMIGNELTPSAKYDFKFKDYAPWVFRSLREDHFALDPADYLVSLTEKYILSELGSPGKSGSFFYYSRDYRFIIKTIHHAEHKFLRRILPQYHAHIAANPHTLLSRFYGLHRVKLPHGRKIHFVVMNNLFPAHLDIHETYDLKGSTVGREYDEAKAKENPRAVLKDVNWIRRHKRLEFGPEKRAFLEAQLERDKVFLQQIQVMDYSLLVGVHNVQRGNRDNLRRNTLKVFSPTPRRQPSSARKPKYEVRTAATHAVDLPDTNPEEQARFIFYADDGGYRATAEDNAPLGTVYYLGVIDILTPWNTKKKLEGIWKGLSADRHKISPVPSHEYGERFFSFLKAVMRGGEGGERFMPKEKETKGKEPEVVDEKQEGQAPPTTAQ